MAAEAQAESPAPAPPPPPAQESSRASPEKRALPGDGGEEEDRRRPNPKRRRACVAALDSVPSAAAVEEVSWPGSACDADAASFSFQHARGGFVALETTPKFGSFNPPGAAEEVTAFDLKPAQADADGEGSPEADDEVPAPAASEQGRDEKSQLVGVEVDGQGQT